MLSCFVHCCAQYKRKSHLHIGFCIHCIQPCNFKHNYLTYLKKEINIYANNKVETRYIFNINGKNTAIVLHLETLESINMKVKFTMRVLEHIENQSCKRNRSKRPTKHQSTHCTSMQQDSTATIQTNAKQIIDKTYRHNPN